MFDLNCLHVIVKTFVKLLRMQVVPTGCLFSGVFGETYRSALNVGVLLKTVPWVTNSLHFVL